MILEQGKVSDAWEKVHEEGGGLCWGKKQILNWEVLQRGLIKVAQQLTSLQSLTQPKYL